MYVLKRGYLKVTFTFILDYIEVIVDVEGARSNCLQNICTHTKCWLILMSMIDLCIIFKMSTISYNISLLQGRQKLARFNAREFATLIIDILNDAKRRQTGVMSPVQIPKEPGRQFRYRNIVVYMCTLIV